MNRSLAITIALSAGFAAGVVTPPLAGLPRPGWLGAAASQTATPSKGGGGGHGHGAGGHDEAKEGPEGSIKMTEQQVGTAGIVLAPAGPGTIARRVGAPGNVTTDADRVARITSRASGRVVEVRKRLGDAVEAGEVVAVVESREVADAKGDFRAASLGLELQQSLVERERKLLEGSISTQKQFLAARSAAEEARIKVEVARQRLAAIGVPAGEVASLAGASPESLRRYEVRSPLAGRVIERRVDLGAAVGQDTELAVVADLSRVWVEAAVAPGDVALMKVGQAVAITANWAGDLRGAGRVIFISPVLDKETRAARVVAEVDNASGAWRPGSTVTAEVTVEEAAADVVLARAALQTIGKDQVVFVRTKEGFEKREVALGKGDGLNVEVVFGVDAREAVAVANSFVLKAELGKAEAEHSH